MTHSALSRPQPGEYEPDFGDYIGLPPDGDLMAFLDVQLAELRGLLGSLSEAESLHKHAPYTWSIRQVVGHMNDCERVFGHRVLRIARDDKTPLTSFDQTAYMQNSDFDRWPLGELLDEFEHVRRSHLLLFRHLAPEAWLRRGTVIGHPATARAFAWVIAGHAKHHLDILHKRLGH